MTKIEAVARAKNAGATDADIEREAALQRRQPATARRNMIYALILHPWNNTKEEWTRLAGALHA